MLDIFSKKRTRPGMLIILSHRHHCVVQLTLLSSGNIKIGTVAASGKLSWSLLDGLVERLFSEYLMLVDPVTNLGLAAESVKSYNIGEIVRRPHESEEPELLPYGYIIGHINTITVSLSDSSSPHVDILAFDTLIPKSIMQRYVALVCSLSLNAKSHFRSLYMLFAG